MKEQLVNYETAKLAKEKGFKYGDLYYDYKGDVIGHEYYYMSDETDIKAPTQSLLQKWLREVHNIHISVIPEEDENFDRVWKNSLYSIEEEVTWLSVSSYQSSFEEALEKGLYHALNFYVNE